jgi:hypothetical protein
MTSTGEGSESKGVPRSPIAAHMTDMPLETPPPYRSFGGCLSSRLAVRFLPRATNDRSQDHKHFRLNRNIPPAIEDRTAELKQTSDD